MSIRRLVAVLAAALVALGLGLAGPTSADAGDRAPRTVRTTITADDAFDPGTFTITVSGEVTARDRRCVKGRLVTLRGFQPVTGTPFVLGTDRASRRGAYAITFNLLEVQFDGRYAATVARLRTAGRRAVTCGAARVLGAPVGR